MGIILKYLLKTMGEKKLRTFLITLAIVLSSAVFFASLSISGSLMEMFTGLIRGYYGNCDVLITQSEKSPSPFFYTAKAESYGHRLEYVVGEVGSGGVFRPSRDEEVNVQLKGIHLDELQKMNPYTIEKQDGLFPFEGRKVIISSQIAEKHGLKLGDTVTIELGEGKFRFRIAALASPTGFFKGDNETAFMVAPKDTLASIANARGKVTSIYIKLKNPAEKQELIKLLSEAYKNYRVEEPFPFDTLKKQTSELSAVFMMLSCVVFFMSVFIIYSSFKVITAERLPVIGTFRSIGATGRITNLLLLGESAAYGIIGGLLGCGLGVVFLYLMAFVMNKMISGAEGIAIDMHIAFSPLQMAAAFVVALVLSLVSSIVPIFKVSRISIKDIVLNFVQKTRKRGKIRLCAGILSVILAFALSYARFEEMEALAAGVGMLLAMTSVVLLIPYVTLVFIRAFEGIYGYLFGNIGILAVKNLRENKNIMNNIAMLAIGISSLLMINTAGYDSAVSITDRYKDSLYDIELYTWRADREFLRMVLNVDGVLDVYGDYEFYHIELAGSKEYVSMIKGVDKTKFTDFFKLESRSDLKPALEKLDEGRNLLVSDALREKLKLKEGDTLRLKTKTGEKGYKVIGFFDRYIYADWNCALAAERFIKADMGAGEFSAVRVKTYKDPEQVAENLRKEFRRRRPYIQTMAQRKEADMNSNKQGMLLMSGFSVLASVIGIFGVLNNLLLSFIERKHALAVLRSMGMSKRQTLRMIFIEAVTGGIIGGGIGILAGMMLIVVLAGASTAARVHFPLDTFLLYVAAGAVIMLLASIGPAMKTAGLNIMDEVKYE